MRMTVRLQVHLKSRVRQGDFSPSRESTMTTSLSAVTWSTARAGLVVGAVALLAGCSGDDDATATTSSGETTTSESVEATDPTVATTSTTSTTIASTTTDPTTTVPESTAPPTSDLPTTTSLPEGVPPRVTFPDDPEKQAVVDAVYAFSDLLFAAQANPTDETLRARVDDVAGEPVRTRFVDFLARVAADGQAFVDEPGSPSYLEIYPEAISVVDGSGLVDGCAVDRTAQVEVDGNPDGSDRIIDATIFSAAQSYSLTLTDRGWRVLDFTVFDEWEGEVGCGN
jgi:hypothetical protein